MNTAVVEAESPRHGSRLLGCDEASRCAWTLFRCARRAACNPQTVRRQHAKRIKLYESHGQASIREEEEVWLRVEGDVLELS